jgi:hypothetical protein
VLFSRRETEKKGNSIALTSQMTPMKTIRMTLASAIFRQFGICFGPFDIAG